MNSLIFGITLLLFISLKCMIANNLDIIFIVNSSNSSSSLDLVYDIISIINPISNKISLIDNNLSVAALANNVDKIYRSGLIYIYLTTYMFYLTFYML